MSAPTTTIWRKPPPRRGVPYYDVATGRTLILPPKGGKAVEYRRAPPEPFSPARALRRAGVRTAAASDAGARTATRTATRTVTGSLPTFTRSDTGWGGLLVYVFLSRIGLALLHNALGGRGPAAVDKILGFLGGGINRLVSPVDPILGKGTLPPPATSTSVGAGGSGPAMTGVPPGSSGLHARKGSGVVAPVGKIIGLPGQGTHSRSEPPNNWQSDNAVDYALPVGTPLKAPEGGVVVNAGYEPGQGPFSTGRFAGQRVTLLGADGQEFFFAHLSAVAVKPGDRIGAGTLIGKSGSANGVAHLHFAVQNGDPLDWLIAAVKGRG